MAKTTTQTLERTYNVPLRKEYQKAPNWKRTPKAVTALREFLVKHMKSENINLDKQVNEKLWQHGIQNPPHHIKIIAKKDEKGIVTASLFGNEKPASKKTPAKSKTEKPAKTTAASKPAAQKKVEVAASA